MKTLFSCKKKFSISFILLNFYLAVMIFLPKTLSSVFNIPIRLGFTILLIITIIYEIYKNKLELNDYRFKGLKIFFILLLISFIPSLFISKNIFTSFYTIIKFISIFSLLFLILKIKFTKEEYKILLKNLIICVLVITILGIIQYIFNINLHIIDSGIEYYPGAKGRVISSFFNTVYYGIFINLVFSIMFYLLNKVKTKKHILLFFLLCILLYINLIFTFTRSAIIIFFAIMVLMLISLNKLLFNKKTLLLITSIIVLTFSIPGANTLIKKSFIDGLKMSCSIASFLPGIDIELPDFLIFDEASEFSDYSLQHREAFATIAKKVASDNLLTGVGIGTYIDYMNSHEFNNKYPEYTLKKVHPHSSMILMYAETGVFGLIFFSLILFGLLFSALLNMLKYFKKDEYKFILSSILFSITCGFVVVNIMSENALYDTQIAYLFVLVYGLLFGYINSISDKKRVVFISSTGGHLSELLQLKPLMKKYNSYLITEKTKTNLSLKNKFSNVYFLVYGTKKDLIKYIFKFSYNFLKSFYYFIRIRPKVIVTTGTHTAVSMCYIAKIFGCKIIYIETFANCYTKTVTGKLIYPIADTFIVQWESMLELYPKAICAGWIY